MKKILVLVLVGLLSGCGSNNDNAGSSEIPSLPQLIEENETKTTVPAKLEVKGVIREFLEFFNTGSAFLTYTGEVVNVGEKPACGVRMKITAKFVDSLTGEDKPWTVDAIVWGDALDWREWGNAGPVSDCLRPGEFGAFKAHFPHSAHPPSFIFEATGLSSDFPEYPTNQKVFICGPITRTISTRTRFDFIFNKRYWGIKLEGRVCNDSSHDIYDPRITFAMYDEWEHSAGKNGIIRIVTDVNPSITLDTALCPFSTHQPEIISAKCLKAGESSVFSVELFTGRSHHVSQEEKERLRTYHKIGYRLIQ